VEGKARKKPLEPFLAPLAILALLATPQRRAHALLAPQGAHTTLLFLKKEEQGEQQKGVRAREAKSYASAYQDNNGRNSHD
jgi:hypothetical protein